MYDCDGGAWVLLDYDTLRVFPNLIEVTNDLVTSNPASYRRFDIEVIAENHNGSPFDGMVRHTFGSSHTEGYFIIEGNCSDDILTTPIYEYSVNGGLVVRSFTNPADSAYFASHYDWNFSDDFMQGTLCDFLNVGKTEDNNLFAELYIDTQIKECRDWSDPWRTVVQCIASNRREIYYKPLQNFPVSVDPNYFSDADSFVMNITMNAADSTDFIVEEHELSLIHI